MMYKPLKLFKLYVTRADGLRVSAKNTVVFLYSEDRDEAITSITKLNIPIFLVRFLGYVIKLPVANRNVKFDINLLKDLKKQKNPPIPYRVDQLLKSEKSFYFDITPFTKRLLKRFKGLIQYIRVLSFMKYIKNVIAENREAVLIITKDKDKDVTNPLIFTILYALRKKLFIPFDKILLHYNGEYVLIYDAQSDHNSYSRVKSIVKNVYAKKYEEKEIVKPEPKTVKKKVDELVNKTVETIPILKKDKRKKEIINMALSKFYENNPEIKSVKVNDMDTALSITQTAVASMFQISPDAMFTMTMNTEDIKKLINDTLLTIESENMRTIRMVITSNDNLNTKEVVSDIIGDLTLDKLLSRREVEQKRITDWLVEVANTLKDKDIPFEIKNIQIIDQESEENEVKKSYYQIWKLTFKVPRGGSQTVELRVPKLIEGRYTKLGGVKSSFPFVLASIPIYIRKPGLVFFHTAYSTISVFEKERKNERGSWVRIANIKMPLILLMGMLKPIPKILKDYGVEFEIRENRCENGFKASKKQWICINGLLDDDVRMLLLGLSFFNTNVDIDVNSDEYARKFIEHRFGAKAIYQIDTIIQNIIDPITKQVLIRKALPDDLYKILEYMNHLVVNKINVDKLDIENIRLRQQDVVLETVYKILNKAYNQYRYQYLTNVKYVKFEVPPNEVINFLRETRATNILEEQCPIEELSEYMKASHVGPGGFVNADALTLQDKNLRLSYFGIFDPMDTSEGSPGVSQYLAVNAPTTTILGLLTPKGFTPKNKKILSFTSAMIPFVEKNDGNRVLMACNQMRQALPVEKAEPPMVQTGYESVVASLTSSSHAVKAEDDGVVRYVDDKMIIVKYKDGTSKSIDLTPHSLFGNVSLKAASIKRPVVKKGQKIKKGDILAVNSFFDKDTLQLSQGTNAVVAFTLYKGYNFEDAVVVSESFAKKFTSYHHSTILVRIKGSRKLTHILPIGAKFNEGDVIASVVSKFSDESRDYLAKYDGEVIDVRVYPNMPFGDQTALKEIIKQKDEIIKERNAIKSAYDVEEEPLESEKIKRNFGKFTIKGELIDGILVEIDLLYKKYFMEGDKIHNRHGNKGIVAKIIPDKDAPVTESGKKIDVIFTNLGVVGRMNMGQVFELYIGRILMELEERIKSLPPKDAYDLIVKVYTMFDTTPDKKYSKSIASQLKTNISKVQSAVKNGKHLTYIADHFNTLTLKDIEKTAKFLGIKLQEKLYFPDLGTYTEKPVSIGMQFIEKLEHMTDVKGASRSLGRYHPVTDQAVRGRRLQGGQRVGEQDTWALISYNANNVLMDLLAVNGDNTKAKRVVLENIIKTGKANLPDDVKDSLSGSRKAIQVYLTGMGISKIPDFNT